MNPTESKVITTVLNVLLGKLTLMAGTIHFIPSHLLQCQLSFNAVLYAIITMSCYVVVFGASIYI
jgi:hypothetical protein